jgi:energy-coupling factor transport system substrate-specific component
MKKFSVKTIVATGIGAALFFVLGRFVAIPSGIPNTNISIQYGLLAFIAAVYGPVAGLLSGLIGHFFIDFSYGWGVWWSWVISSALFGLAMGFATRKYTLEDGQFSKRDAVGFNVAQVLCNLLAWAVIAPLLDIVMYAEPANKVFIQGLGSAAINALATAVVGTLLLFAYAAAKPKKGSLKKEN